MLGKGLLEVFHAYRVSNRERSNAAFLSSVMSILAGLLLLSHSKLVITGQAVLLGLSFGIDGFGQVIAALRSRDKPGWFSHFTDGVISVLLGVAIAMQWPVSGIVSLGLTVGLRLISSGWAMILGRSDSPPVSEVDLHRMHPNTGLGLPAHDTFARLREAVEKEILTRRSIDRYWWIVFLVVFFAIHVGRMDAEWNLVGFISPGVAVVGDVLYALLLSWGVVLPVRLGWRKLTSSLERRAWMRKLAQQGDEALSLRRSLVDTWLHRRFRFALQYSQARNSPTSAFAWGLHIGLPLTAVLIALNPIWGLSWYFNTENWATGAWERWTEYRVDDWREHMVQEVRKEYVSLGGKEADLARIKLQDVPADKDFSFIVIGDTGEGDASQHVLRDRLVLLGQRPDIKFLVLSSDVIYPSGAMKDYEPKFYLPFKGFSKPIYAIPGNHDWYDALEAFTANFFEPAAARTAMRARRAVDHGLTTTTEKRIDQLIEEAARLRGLYGVSTGHQRTPFLEIHTDQFSLILVDTGILRSSDPEQLRWLEAALKRAQGHFTMAILGHPLYAGGQYQGATEKTFAGIHQMLRDHGVQIAMGGDTHYFEYYKESYQNNQMSSTMHHFVNGGGGAYLALGTPLGWPRQPPVADCGFYPRKDEIVAKLDRETPLWKLPLWLWVKKLGGWPFNAEGIASAFNFNLAPFFQSFVEVRVESSRNSVRIIPHGVLGPLQWRDLQVFGQVIPTGKKPEDGVEFVFSMVR